MLAGALLFAPDAVRAERARVLTGNARETTGAGILAGHWVTRRIACEFINQDYALHIKRNQLYVFYFITIHGVEIITP